MRLPVRLFILLGALCLLAPSVSARVWGDAEGKLRVVAELVRTEGGEAFLKEQDGRVFAIPFSFLRSEDQQYIEQWVRKQSVQKFASLYAATRS